MKKFLIMTKGVLIAFSTVGTVYADQESSSRQSSLSYWTGIYAGLDAGLAFNRLQLRSQQTGFTNPSEHCNTNSDFSTFFPGIQLGYLHQFPSTFVSGIETNVTFNTNQHDTLACRCPYNFSVSDRFSVWNQMQSSIKGRAGRALSWNTSTLLPYLTAGVSFANAGLTYKNEGGDYYFKNTTQAGWLIGTGIEWSLEKSWSLRAEYSYVDYGNNINLKLPSVYGLDDPNGNAHVKLTANNFSLGINYWI